MNQKVNNFLNTLVLLILACIFLLVAALQLRSSGGLVIMDLSHWIGWVFVALISAVGLILASYQGNLIIPELFKAVSLYILLVLVAAIFANDFNFQILWEWYGFLAGLMFFLALHQTYLGIRFEQKILWIILISGVTQAVMGYLQYYSIPIGTYSFRPTSAVGGFYQVNNFSSYIATAALIPLLLHLPQRKNKLVQGILIVMLIVVAYSLYLASSRTGLIGLIIGSMLVIYGRWGSRDTLKMRYPHRLPSWLWLLATMAGYLMAHFSADTAIVDKLAALNDYGSLARRGMYQSTWNLFLDQPLFGQGLGTFTKLFQPAHVTQMQQLANPAIITSVTIHPHNEMLYRLSESGLIGTVGLVLIASSTASILWVLPNKQGWLYAGLMFPLLFHTQTEFPFYSSLLSWILFLTLLYLASQHAIFSIRLPLLLRKNRWLSSRVIFLILLITLAFLANKMVRSVDFMQALIWTKNSQDKPSVRMLQYSLGDNFNDNYYALPSRRLVLLQQSVWIQTLATKAEAAAFLEELHNTYSYYPTVSYYNLQVLSLTTQERFLEAWQLLESSARLYPNYSHVHQLQKIVLKKRLSYITSRKPLSEKEDDSANNIMIFNHYVKWMEKADLKGYLLTDSDYYFGIYSLYKVGDEFKATHLLKSALKLHPDSALLKNVAFNSAWAL